MEIAMRSCPAMAGTSPSSDFLRPPLITRSLRPPVVITRSWRPFLIRSRTSSPSPSRSPSTSRFSRTNSRLSLLIALSSQAAVQAQRSLQSLTSEAIKYVSPRRGRARNLEEALMSVPDLETVPYTILRREADYEIRQVESFVVAETIMPAKTGFDFYGASQGFNTLAAYLFGKNKKREEMEMTTPVIVSRSQSEGEKMEMTTPVISRQMEKGGQWQMSFLMPSKYGDDLPVPVDDSVKIKRVPPKMIAVSAFSGYVTDEGVKQRERKLRRAVGKDPKVTVKESAQVEVSQFNPPFTPPFLRRNEVALEVVQVNS